jgi:nitrate/TMAO reductase-like tetraheme cytochrome c subunit
MRDRTLLLLVAVMLVGLFALPNALSLFAGQHSFDKPGDGTICQKCHSDVYSELSTASTYHTSISGSSTPCKACHSTGYVSSSAMPLGNGTNGTGTSDVGLNITSGEWSNGNGTNATYTGIHAAITVECVSCHYAVNFTNDAHKAFADNATSEVYLNGANEACVGCHTKVYVNMTWIRKGGYNYTYEFNTTAGTWAFNDTDVYTYTNNTG